MRGFSLAELDIEHIMQQEFTATCTDGGTVALGQGIPHPRFYGTFPRKLRQFVHEERLISLPFAVRGMTSLPAAFLGIPDRGLVKPGFFADLVVFDESELRDMATYESPFEYARGIVHVMVNGSFALRDGKPTEVLAGRPIRRGGASEAEERR